MLYVLQIGHPVRIASDIEGHVTGVCIKESSYVQYQVVWWQDRARHSEWLEEAEVAPIGDAQKQSIGFLAGVR